MSKKSIIITVSIIGGIVVILLVLNAIGKSMDTNKTSASENLSDYADLDTSVAADNNEITDISGTVDNYRGDDSIMNDPTKQEMHLNEVNLV